MPNFCVLCWYWILIAVQSTIFQMRASGRVQCYTCTVDFRSSPFNINDSCLVPSDTRNRADCSESSKFCKGVATRISGVLALFQRSCDTDCVETCMEKGFGIATSECTFCCPNDPKCGTQSFLGSGSA